eukprot:TRINITY_DN5936_c0_g1_i1.p1 TRINITY_DN5936_c0_g1~~TRINITY_DN5936_c0_g1_i1.p1  ORF type:complete len:333 (-),score=118.43 TRINITY_DN5936_c0_g1_i1:161-1159(-)
MPVKKAAKKTPLDGDNAVRLEAKAETNAQNTAQSDHVETNDSDNDDSASTKKEILSKKKLDKYRKEESRKGIVYLSKIPPYMKPEKLRHLMSQFGQIGRIYLAPEDEKLRRKRVKNGGNKKVKYTEGWIEFLNKKTAKRVAESLNNTPLGGSKSSMYYEDIWNMKYLSKFKWHHLTEKIAYEKSVRQQKLVNEYSQAKKENAFYLSRVAEAKKKEYLEKMKGTKRKAKSQDEEEDQDDEDHDGEENGDYEIEGEDGEDEGFDDASENEGDDESVEEDEIETVKKLDPAVIEKAKRKGAGKRFKQVAPLESKDTAIDEGFLHKIFTSKKQTKS